MPNNANRAAGPAATVSPYYLSAESRELLKRRGAEIRVDLQQRRHERGWPQVEPSAPKGLLSWPRTLLAAACLFTTVTAQATEWQHAAETPDGATWAWRAGTGSREIVRGGEARTIVVQRKVGAEHWLYKAAARDEACTARRGEVHLLTLASAHVETTVFTRGDRSVAAALALVLCRNAPGPRQ